MAWFLTDVEARYRQRYLDLVTNGTFSVKCLRKRIVILRARPGVSWRRVDLQEVETPMLQTIAGGAAAEPFRTHHKALGIDLYLRIAPSFTLSACSLADSTRCSEVNRNFRNEGISRRHNPEFTMLEAYWAYANFEKLRTWSRN